MDLSRQSSYAIQALAFLAERPGRLISVKTVGESIDAPLPFLAKILSTLSRKGLVVARRGPNGGVMLGRDPSRVSLGEVVAVFDGPRRDGRCYLGLRDCSPNNPCPVHDSWHALCDGMARTLRERTLEDFRNVRRGRPRS